MLARLLLILFLICQTGTAAAQLYGLIDNRAKTATWEQATDKQSLVQHLTQNLTSDTDKARAIAAWIAFQMQRDGYRRYVLIKASDQNRLAPEPLPNDPFITRIGTPRDFAELFQELASLAGLKAVTIDGFAGKNIRAFRYQAPKYRAGETLYHFWTQTNYPLQRYQATWNAVQIDDEWRLLDTYFMIADDDLYAAKTIRTDFAMKSFLKQRLRRHPTVRTLTAAKRIDNDYFLANPRRFAKTHFPLDSQWQLLSVPLTWASFINQ